MYASTTAQRSVTDIHAQTNDVLRDVVPLDTHFLLAKPHGIVEGPDKLLTFDHLHTIFVQVRCHRTALQVFLEQLLDEVSFLVQEDVLDMNQPASGLASQTIQSIQTKLEVAATKFGGAVCTLNACNGFVPYRHPFPESLHLGKRFLHFEQTCDGHADGHPPLLQKPSAPALLFISEFLLCCNLPVLLELLRRRQDFEVSVGAPTCCMQEHHSAVLLSSGRGLRFVLV